MAEETVFEAIEKTNPSKLSGGEVERSIKEEIKIPKLKKQISKKSAIKKGIKDKKLITEVAKALSTLKPRPKKDIRLTPTLPTSQLRRNILSTTPFEEAIKRTSQQKKKPMSFFGKGGFL